MILGLGYKARSGKDTFAGLLARYGFRSLAFADPLKSAARELFGLSGTQLFGDAKELVDEFWGLTPRNIMQRLGTEAMRREFGDDFWVRALRRRIDTQESNVGRELLWVITDVRFINEAVAVQSWGGKVLRIDRPGARARGGVTGHASETELDSWTGWDGCVENVGTIDDLAEKARLVARDLARGAA